jgi:hypothetical protein
VEAVAREAAVIELGESANEHGENECPIAQRVEDEIREERASDVVLWDRDYGHELLQG